MWTLVALRSTSWDALADPPVARAASRETDRASAARGMFLEGTERALSMSSSPQRCSVGS
jgi:hypothetical protein